MNEREYVRELVVDSTVSNNISLAQVESVDPIFESESQLKLRYFNLFKTNAVLF